MTTWESVYLQGIEITVKEPTLGVIEVNRNNYKVMEITDDKLFKEENKDITTAVINKYLYEIINSMHEQVDKLIKGKSYC